MPHPALFGLPENIYSNFICEQSDFSRDESTWLYDWIVHSATLRSLVEERYHHRVRCCGWTSNGSKGYTDIDTGNIYIGRTRTGSEPLTLGYECINSRIGMCTRKLHTVMHNCPIIQKIVRFLPEKFYLSKQKRC